MIDKTKLFFGLKKTSTEQPYAQHDFDLDEKKQIRFQWSNNPSHVKQYSKIIDNSFDEELNLRNVYKKISKTDFSSHYRLMFDGEKVVGGFRIVFSNPLEEFSLPSEKIGFTFKDMFPEIDLANNSYCELSRYAVLPEYRRNVESYIDAFASTRDLMTQNNIKYMFGCSSRSRLRVYNKVGKSYFTISEPREFDISSLGLYEDLEFFVCCYDNPEVRISTKKGS